VDDPESESTWPEPDPTDKGSVFVNWTTLEDDLWGATWQRGAEHRALDSATRAEAIAWGLAQAASHYWIFSAEADDWVPLEGSTAQEGEP
jgi:hypothetical protein